MPFTVHLAMRFAVAFGATVATVPLMKRIATRLAVVAQPSNDRWHRGTIPLMGGGAIVCGIMAAAAIWPGAPWWLIVSALAMFALGLADDFIALTPGKKLLGQTAIVILMLTQMPPILGPNVRAIELAGEVLWVVALVNAVNLLDHLDGLAAGVVTIEALAAATILALHGAGGMALVGVAVAGAAAGFLVFNYNPASIFMGDGGALTLGLLLAILALEVARISVRSQIAHMAAPFLVTLVPLMDTTIVTVTRAASGHRVSRGGRDHSSHRLVGLGLSDRRAALVLYGLAAIAAVFAVDLSGRRDVAINMAIPFVLLTFALIGVFLMNLSFDREAPGHVYYRVHRLARTILMLSYKRRVVELALDTLVITCAYYATWLIKFDFAISDAQAAAVDRELPTMLLISYAGLLATRSYRGIWQFATLADGWRLMKAAGAIAAIMLIASRIHPLRMDLSASLVFVILLFNFLLASRLSFRIFAGVLHRFAVARRKVVIVGAGTEGEAAVRYFFATPGARAFQMLGFVDDDEFKRGKLIHGYPVLGSLGDLAGVYKRRHFEELLVAEDSLAPDKLRQVIEFAEKAALIVRRFSLAIGQMSTVGAEAETLPAK